MNGWSESASGMESAYHLLISIQGNRIGSFRDIMTITTRWMMIGNPHRLSGGGKEYEGEGGVEERRVSIKWATRVGWRQEGLDYVTGCMLNMYICSSGSLSQNPFYLASTNAHFSPNMRSSQLAFALLCASTLTSAAPLAAVENHASVAEVIRSHAVARSVTGPAFDQGQPIDAEGNGAAFSGWQWSLWNFCFFGETRLINFKTEPITNLISKIQTTLAALMLLTMASFPIWNGVSLTRICDSSRAVGSESRLSQICRQALISRRPKCI